MRRLPFLLLALLTASTPLAQSHTFIGPNEGCEDMGMAGNAWQCPFNWSAGTAPESSSTVFINADEVAGVFSSAAVAGLILEGFSTDLRTAGSLQVTNAFEWRGGTIETNGTVSISSIGTISGSSGKRLRATDLRIDATGIVTWTGGQIFIDGDATVDNRGTFDARADADFLLNSSGDQPPFFLNRSTGRLAREAGDGTVLFRGNLRNEGGLIEVRSGTLRIDDNSSRPAVLLGGTYTATPDGTLLLRRAVISGTLSGTPNGFVGTENGTIIEIDETATLDFDGEGFQWAGGFFRDGTVTNAGLVRINSNFHDVENATFRNEGTILHEDGDVRLRTATFENAGLFDVMTTDRFALGATTFGTTEFINDAGGTIRLSISDESRVTTTLRNRNGGVIELGDGRLFMNTNSALDLQPGSILRGNGTVDPLSGNETTVAGIIEPGQSPGTLTYDNDRFQPFAPTVDAVLDIEIGGPTPGTEHDQIVVPGSVELGGTLRVTLLDDFMPSPGDRFLIIPPPTDAASTVTGSFDVLDLPDGLTATVEASVADGIELVIGMNTASEDDALPTAFALRSAAPNPFATTTALPYDVPEAANVRVEAFDVLGRRVAILVNETRPAGRFEAELDGRALPSGVYIVRLATDHGTHTRRVTLLR